MPRSWLYRSSRGFVLAAFALLFGAGSVLAQTGRIEGTVRNASTGDPLPGARVTVIGTDLAATTNQNGYYAIPGVPVGSQEVRVSVLGYQQVTITNQRVAVGLPTTVNFQLAASILRIEGVVVTGVAEAQQAVKLPFTVDQVKAEDMPVPVSNPEEAIRGKVAGAKIVRGRGTPGDGAAVLLRGATSINTSGRSNEPLYIVDGVILSAGLTDVSSLDIESIEVVKGAAASSLYGSRAANGVIQIQTRRGHDLPEGETRITVRSELGVNQLAKKVALNRSHWFQTSADGLDWLDSGGSVTADRTARVLDTQSDTTTGGAWTFADNPYPLEVSQGVEALFNPMDEFFNPGNFMTNSVSVSHRTGSTNFLASFSDLRESGIVRNVDGYRRRSARLNVDHKIGQALDFSASGYYSRSDADDPEQGPGEFFALMFYPPDINLDSLEPNPRDSFDYVIQPDPAVLEENPLYSPSNVDRSEERGRVLGSFRVRYRPIDWFDVASEMSFDRSDRNNTTYYFKGFKTIDASTLNNGVIDKNNGFTQSVNGSLTASVNRRFGDLSTNVRLRGLFEREQGQFFSAHAENLVVDKVVDLDVGDATLSQVSSSSDEIKSLGYYISTQMDYKDRYIIDALVRRDGSSLFGPENRWRTYYRIGGAYRMAQESWWPIEALDEFKLRLSRGTAGGRPSFVSQYETYGVSAGNVSKGNLGNTALVPEYATETEFGLDMVAFGRVSLGLTRAISKVEDQILLVPLAGYFGFSNQWRNAGTLETKTWEGQLQAQLMQRENFGWSVNLVMDNTEQRITEFNLPAYRTGPEQSFYMREGEEFGTMYGTRWATSCSDLEAISVSSASCTANFQVNDDGYMVYVGAGNTFMEGVPKALWGTTGDVDGSTFPWGMPTASYETEIDAFGDTVVTNFLKIGNTIPDLNWGLGTNVRIGGFNIYGLFDAQVGGDVYNNTRQWGARELNAVEVDQRGKEDGLKKPIDYYNALYAVNAINSHYAEDASYVKLRELSVRYTFGRSQLEGVFGGLLKRVTLAFIGRNLITWSDYSGFDPEVSTQGSESAVFRFDGFGYPNYRTLTGSVEIEF